MDKASSRNGEIVRRLRYFHVVLPIAKRAKVFEVPNQGTRFSTASFVQFVILKEVPLVFGKPALVNVP